MLTTYFSLANEQFSCTKKVLGNNNHRLWYASRLTADVWWINPLKGFRTSEACITFMQNQIAKRLKQLTAAKFKLN